MVQILNGIDLMKGKKVAEKRTYGITQPLQLIPMKEKNDEWTCWNMDWLEWNGIRQIAENRKRFMKNYRLAEGIIDKSDYVPENNNDMKDIVENLIDGAQELEVMELKFFPIIPNVLKTYKSSAISCNSNSLSAAVLFPVGTKDIVKFSSHNLKLLATTLNSFIFHPPYSMLIITYIFHKKTFFLVFL